MSVRAPRFNLADAERAHNEWGANCGPGALAAIMHLTLDEVRLHMGDFESKGYTNPTLMFAALKSVGARWDFCRFGYSSEGGVKQWPRYGLCRVQWEGPWMKPGVPMAARYRFTHWVGSCAESNDDIGVFDINCINNGAGWVAKAEWETVIVPHILRECVPRASGAWHLTHSIEVKRP